jgi:hypothetical protein
MVKLTSVLSVLTTIVAVTLIFYAPFNNTELENSFNNYVSQFSKSYNSKTEFDFRMQVFKDNMEQARILQEQNPLARFGATIFSDQTEQEMLQRMGDIEVDADITPNEIFTETSKTSGNIDWSRSFQPIQNQGQCGSCWAFAATATYEAYVKELRQDSTKYSEQELVDCVPTCSGCNGGLAHLGYQWLSQGNQFCTEASYPYEMKDANCRSSTCGGKSTDAGFGIVQGGESAMINKLSEGPLSVSVDASVWHSYQGGVLTSCGQATNHAVVVMKYTEDNDGKTWTIRNSWGPQWGEQGHIRLRFGDNVCNVSRRPSYPTF